MRAQMTRLCPQTRRFLMRLSRAASGARQADQRRSRYASGCGRVHGVASWAGGGCYAAVPSDQALLPSVHSKWMLCEMGGERFTGASLMQREFSRCRASASAMCGAPAVMRIMRLAYHCT